MLITHSITIFIKDGAEVKFETDPENKNYRLAYDHVEDGIKVLEQQSSQQRPNTMFITAIHFFRHADYMIEMREG